MGCARAKIHNILRASAQIAEQAIPNRRLNRAIESVGRVTELRKRRQRGLAQALAVIQKAPYPRQAKGVRPASVLLGLGCPSFIDDPDADQLTVSVPFYRRAEMAGDDRERDGLCQELDQMRPQREPSETVETDREPQCAVFHRLSRS